MSTAGPNPKLSVLMVNWNTRDMTIACLRSLLRETTKLSFEVILVDNGSHDGSAEAVCAEFPAVTVLAEQANHGFAAANNLAASKARGEYLLLLNTDTLVRDNAVERLVDFAEANPANRIWGGRTLFEDGALNPTSVWGSITPWSAISHALGLSTAFSHVELFNPEGFGGWPRNNVRQVDIVSGCFFLIKRKFWSQLRGFDHAFFMYGEEADLCARARQLGASPIMTPDAVITHYGGASAAKFADKIVHVFAARIGLIDRQLSGVGKLVAQYATIMGVLSRALGYRILLLFPRNGASSSIAREWISAWRRRDEWRWGPGVTATSGLAQ